MKLIGSEYIKNNSYNMKRSVFYSSPESETIILRPESALCVISFSQTDKTEILTDDEETDL